MLNRQGKGQLRDLIVKPKNLTRYKRATKAFFVFVREAQLNAVLSRSVDEALCLFIQAAWEQGEPIGAATDLLSGLSHFLPRLRGGLRGAWRLVSAWSKNEKPQRPAPFSQDTLYAFAGAALVRYGEALTLGILLAFHCMLRPGELLNVRSDHFLFSGSRGTLTLPEAKSGARINAPESVLIADAVLIRALQNWIAGLERPERLAPWTETRFRGAFHMLLRDSGLHSVAYDAPRSLRRGGATHDFGWHGLIDKTVVRGRWKQQRACRIYVDEAMAHLAGISMTPRAQARVEASKRRFLHFLVRQ